MLSYTELPTKDENLIITEKYLTVEFGLLSLIKFLMVKLINLKNKNIKFTVVGNQD